GTPGGRCALWHGPAIRRLPSERDSGGALRAARARMQPREPDERSDRLRDTGGRALASGWKRRGAVARVEPFVARISNGGRQGGGGGERRERTRPARTLAAQREFGDGVQHALPASDAQGLGPGSSRLRPARPRTG